MSNKLALQAILALSVANLETHLSETAYDANELAEFSAAEAEGDNRKTALEAYSEAVASLEAPNPDPEPTGKVHRVSGKVSALTTMAGIKKAGDVVTASMVSGGADTFAKLVKKGLIE